jgi:hypothetical protein
MVRLMKGAVLVGAVSLVLGGLANATLDPAEFKTEGKASKAAAKYVGALTKCAVKCYTGAWKPTPTNPFSDCVDPFGGATATCIDDPILLKGANNKYDAAIVKAATPPAGACPSCYDGGDCSLGGYATTRQQQLLNNVNLFNPLVYCKTTGATAAEQKCMNNTAKTLTKLVGAVDKCYDKCLAGEFKGTAGVGTCRTDSVGSDLKLIACVVKATAKSVAGVNKLCGDVGAIPDGGAGPCSNYLPDGSFLTNAVGAVIGAEVPNNYCESPSGAFIE